MTYMKIAAAIRWVELAISLVGSFVRGLGAGTVGLFFLAIAIADESTPFSEFLRVFHSAIGGLVMIGLGNVLWVLVSWMFSTSPQLKQ
ncbi:hypothetical protein [Pseudomonas amygdali]|uniref:hypothetical protein n=1 Tax=Pseudomonas amygdali TaxID=47877 RepID=UPI0001CC3E3A|nr:hypothetical protein [Pseudomonas amygdali]KWT13181.1 hypothetical protein AL041_14890 [Pseudomonas amygdali pv. aesculi]KWT20202.1 hypothetical protein AL044_00145 [Pseudomonas amygdali pv. aesculi]KWT23861.1 hypothetical protein AL043_21805 [Pseudomonas amygdali pv. aesculi]KWT27844.1 hypothetical protein AL042_13060 [Pseudomonas amygdali pv. aesculi]KWT34373.1 hypothetical protein AL045_27335 [Pseudomonas amygdali pv. aesculi]